MLTLIASAVAAAIAGIGYALMQARKAGRLQLDAETARRDALLQRRMAAVPKPSETEALKRLDDGTA